MAKTLRRLLIMVMILSMLPTGAYAAAIRLGGKVGFMYENMSVTLKPKLAGVKRGNLVWASSDTDVATVKGGKITSKSAGLTTVSVSGGGASAKCGVVVLPRSVEVKAGESLSLPYGGVEKYAVQHKRIASISRSGVITGKAAGNTRVLVAYGRQKLLINVKVTNAQAAAQSEAAKLSCANETDQIVLVDHQSGSRATLSIHEKKNGVWTQLASCNAYLGSKGIGKTKEGDRKTPTGTFNLTMPFGIKADPGAKMDYTKVTKYHYWCGTSSSEYYNQLVDMRKIDRKYTSSDEYLINYGSVYNYCMFIDYNAEGTPGKGSCIFLHCTGKNKYTAGCIAISESMMKKIIQWAKPGAKIVIR